MFDFNAITRSDEMVQMIGDFPQTYRLGIITNGPADISYKKVIRLGLEQWIPEQAVFVSERVGYAKPDRRIFDAALAYFRVDAGEVVFVGDNWNADIVGALGAGMAAVWLNRRKDQPESDHKPLAVIEDLSDLKEVLARGCTPPGAIV